MTNRNEGEQKNEANLRLTSFSVNYVSISLYWFIRSPGPDALDCWPAVLSSNDR